MFAIEFFNWYDIWVFRASNWYARLWPSPSTSEVFWYIDDSTINIVVVIIIIIIIKHDKKQTNINVQWITKFIILENDSIYITLFPAQTVQLAPLHDKSLFICHQASRQQSTTHFTADSAQQTRWPGTSFIDKINHCHHYQAVLYVFFLI